MKYRLIINIVLGVLLSSSIIQAKNIEFNWVLDKNISSEDVLSKSLSSRVINRPKDKVIKDVRQILSKDLHMSLADYDKSFQEQTAQTTNRTLLPKTKGNRKLTGKNFKFQLTVKVVEANGNTKIKVRAQPIYRIKKKTNEKDNEIKIKTSADQAVMIGSLYVLSVEGKALDYDAKTLADAESRCVNLVRYFMHEFDKQSQNNISTEIE